MTLPSERYRAILRAKNFLRDLMDPKATPKVPRWIRTEAYYALKHFPHEHEVEHLAEASPDILDSGVTKEQKFNKKVKKVLDET